ncbi:type II toxin-antitoxin system RelB/DinJ family antitoxin [Acidaminobacter hydrogenoformans]|uniref:DNA-damage-inducible protein J n=1 Tax=Acidaminobacter hydrogenoformans DSM 2784 TaxID=1120920 RepID=A0A1G5S6X4_9FIRM|nr:type II toxin-antitoxin system RelB/DinJ family antitoxin [Acidaminobacter hydrogenoformans]SCZ82122.1 DNA-damage-inducible protein J [Acidaminobacter hydrogenoformans DSM 2784]
MAQTTLSVRMDENIKKQFDAFCAEVGMNTSVAINLFAKAVLRERRIPFEIALNDDPFYSDANLDRLKKAIAQLDESNLIVKSMDELEEMERE